MDSQQRTQRAVVTGGAGFIGGALSALLLDSGWEVIVVDDLSGGSRDRVPPGARLEVVDIRDTALLQGIIKSGDTIFHLAAIPSVEYSLAAPDHTHSVNVQGTLSVLMAAKAKGAHRVVYSASCAAYGDQKTVPFVETSEVRPLSPYALQKWVGEEYVRLFAKHKGLPGVALRYFNVYGEGQKLVGPYASVIGHFLVAKRSGLPLPIIGDGEQTRDFVHVKDIARANLLAATRSGLGNGETINVGSGRAVTINQFAAHFDHPTTAVPPRAGEIRHALADITAARALLGWEPEISLEDGLRSLLRHHGF